MAKDIYIFSGLGVDERVFKHIDFSGYNAHFVKWLIPEKKETLKAYCKRLIEQIDTTHPVLIGLSFGGIIAIEVAKQIEPECVILIASAKTKKELPFYYRWMGFINLHKLMPAKLALKPNFITSWIFGITSRQDKKLLKEILQDTNPLFFKWAIDKIVNWNNVTAPEKLIHIHGTADRILPIRFITSTNKINGGGHFMTINKSQEVSSALQSALEKAINSHE